MNKTVTLQVPMKRELKEAAEAVALDYGFSSIQEAIRLLLNKFAKKELLVTFTEAEPVQLSKEAEKRYEKEIEDIKVGRGVTKTKNVEELFQLLKS